MGCSALRPHIPRALVWALLALMLVYAGSLAASTMASDRVPPQVAVERSTLTFGILPIGGPSESLAAWSPMLDNMAHALHRPVRSVSVSTYGGLAQAIARQRIDIAFLSGQLALTEVRQGRMQVIAQLTRSEGSQGYRAVLLVAADSPLHSVQQLLDQPGRWRYARNEHLSMSGCRVPESELFARRGLDSDLFFRSVEIDNHQNNAFAVANGEADVATNNTADLERFAQRFPEAFSRLRVLWQSALIPHAVIMVRNDLSPQRRQQIARFVTDYAKRGVRRDEELVRLKRIHDISGFSHADNRVLLPFANIDYALKRRQALASQWVNQSSLAARLQQIDREHQQTLRQLQQSVQGTRVGEVEH